METIAEMVMSVSHSLLNSRIAVGLEMITVRYREQLIVIIFRKKMRLPRWSWRLDNR